MSSRHISFSTEVTLAYVEVDADVELTDRDLEDNGLLRVEEWEKAPGAADTLGELHRQAHPDEPYNPARCMREPCRDTHWEPPSGIYRPDCCW